MTRNIALKTSKNGIAGLGRAKIISKALSLSASVSKLGSMNCVEFPTILLIIESK